MPNLNFLCSTALLLLFFISGNTLLGQGLNTSQPNHQWIKLRDGSKYKVSSYEKNEATESYSIILSSGERLNVPIAAVKRVQKKTREGHINNKGNFIPTKGRYGSIGIGVFINQDRESRFGNLNIGLNVVQFSYGLYLLEKWAVAAGTSLDIYEGNVILPFFLEGKRFFFPRSSLAPYVGTRLGVGPGLNWRGTGGTMVHPHVGLRCASKSGVQVNLEFGVRLQQQRNFFWDGLEVMTFRRYSLGLALSF